MSIITSAVLTAIRSDNVDELKRLFSSGIGAACVNGLLLKAAVAEKAINIIQLLKANGASASKLEMSWAIDNENGEIVNLLLTPTLLTELAPGLSAKKLGWILEKLEPIELSSAEEFANALSGLGDHAVTAAEWLADISEEADNQLPS